MIQSTHSSGSLFSAVITSPQTILLTGSLNNSVLPRRRKRKAEDAFASFGLSSLAWGGFGNLRLYGFLLKRQIIVIVILTQPLSVRCVCTCDILSRLPCVFASGLLVPWQSDARSRTASLPLQIQWLWRVMSTLIVVQSFCILRDYF